MNTKKYVSLGLVLSIIGGFAVVVPALADTGTGTLPPVYYNKGNDGRGLGMMRRSVLGTVSVISGNTITVTGKQFSNNNNGNPTQTPITYTVDTTNSVVIKNKVIAKVSDIVVGDTVAIQGTITGTNIVATTIRDGVMMGVKGTENNKAGEDKGKGNRPMMASSTPIIQGNGQPIIGGTISVINGTTLTVTNKSNVTYTVDTTNAKIAQGNVLVSLSNLKVGDSVLVQGTVNGTSIVASSVIDQTKLGNTSNESNAIGAQHKGFFGSIGQFFARMFGF